LQVAQPSKINDNIFIYIFFFFLLLDLKWCALTGLIVILWWQWMMLSDEEKSGVSFVLCFEKLLVHSTMQTLLKMMVLKANTSH